VPSLRFGNRRPSWLVPALIYGLAIVATLATLQLRLAVDTVADDGAFLVFLVPIILTAFLGGLRPALVATAAAAVVSVYFLVPPRGSFAVADPVDYMRVAVLVLAGVMAAAMCGRLRRVVEALRESEERLQMVVENLTEGIVISDADGELLHWNRAGLEMHGFGGLDEARRDLVHFREIFELSTPDGTVLPFDQWPLPRILRGEHLRELDLRIRRLDVAWERIFSYGGALVPAPGGRLLAMLTITDVTARKQLEAQLRQTQKMESIGRLAGGIAHDFNNWLTVISGSADLLSEVVPPDPVPAQLLGEIRHAGKRAASLTRQLLAFSRREVLEPRVLDLNAVVADAEKMLCRMLGEDILLTAALDPTIRRVRIDAGQWIQVLMNLAVNARDAMPTGGRLTIETRETALDDAYARLHPNVRPGRYVLMVVTDTGSGMSPEIQARIFDPFFTTKPIGEGTGLGLSVVHGIVEQSGGHVGVYSEPGVGTAFKIYLPPVTEAAEAAPTPAPEPALDGRGTETILLVEDDDSVRRVTGRILRRFGYTVLEAEGGEAALRLLGQEPGRVALLISDVVMPNMDGRELIKRVHAQYPEIKVLFTSGYTNDAVIRHGVLHAEVAFIQKPHTSAMLVAKIREVLDRR
jgi:signal transduction histidine kinase/CheY-like chemotaxis protein